MHVLSIIQTIFTKIYFCFGVKKQLWYLSLQKDFRSKTPQTDQIFMLKMKGN